MYPKNVKHSCGEYAVAEPINEQNTRSFFIKKNNDNYDKKLNNSLRCYRTGYFSKPNLNSNKLKSTLKRIHAQVYVYVHTCIPVIMLKGKNNIYVTNDV